MATDVGSIGGGVVSEEGRDELWGRESSGSNGPEHKGDDGEHIAQHEPAG